MTDRLLRVWLSTKETITPRISAALLAHFGDPAHIYAAECEEFLACGFLRKQHIDALCDKDTAYAEEVLRRCEREHITVLTPADPSYPTRLTQIPDPPQVLYVRGRLPDFDSAPGIAIVGTRHCTAYGMAQAQKFGAALAEAGFTIVTGMALGADGAANQGALRVGRPTVGVFAGGVDICYPPQHRHLMGDILIDGAILSENPPGTPHAKQLFPVRNRILSGLCAATLVIEAPVRSGALITARTALEQGRDIFALPGSLDNPHAAGSNRLLRDGEAAIVLDPMDIVHELSGLLRTMPDSERIRAIYLRESGGAEPREEPAPPQKEKQKPKQVKKENERPGLFQKLRREEPRVPTMEELDARPKPCLADLAGDEKLVAEVMQKGAKNPDDIIRMSGLSPSRALSALTMLEMDGLVKGSPTEVWLV